MSLKTETKAAMAASSSQSGGKAASIATRLTLWYALLSIVLIAAAGTVMYWVLVDRLRQEDDQLLAGRIAELRAILELHPPGSALFLEEARREATMLPGIQVRMQDSRGDRIFETVGIQSALFDHFPPASEAAHSTDWRAPGGDFYRIMAVGIAVGSGYTVQIAMSRSKEEELLAAFRRMLWLAITAALVIAVAAGYFIARREMRPVSRLAALVAELNAADLHRRVGTHWPQELQPLASNFDQLLARLEDAFARMSQFSADIAHELRTPLHILQGEAELVLTRTRSSEAYRACIESAAEEYQHLATMVDALLFLARAEQPDALLDRQPLQLNHEVATVCNFYQAMADEQAVALVSEGSAQILADAALLRRALGNLLGNALRHTRAGGRIVIAVRQQPDLGAEISVSDTGDGIAPDALAHVFDRFYRADGARSRAKAGTGLGLSIVKFIMELHGGAASIQSELYQGTTVTLTFPA